MNTFYLFNSKGIAMDRGIKMLLFVIAVSLIILNLQIAGISFLPEAHAELEAYDLTGIENALGDISRDLRSISRAISNK